MTAAEDNQVVACYTLSGGRVEVVGSWTPDTPENEYEWYDVYRDGVCLTANCSMDASGGRPIPTQHEVENYLFRERGKHAI